MRIPNAFSSVFGLSFKLAFLQVCLCGLALNFLELGPASLEQLRCDVNAGHFDGANVAGRVVVGGQRVRDGERDGFAYDACAEVFACFVGPRLTI